MSDSSSPASKPKGLNIILWIVQFVLAAMYLMAGIMKSTTPIAELSQKLPWTAVVPELMVRCIGISEFLGALGLLLPALLRVKPSLTPLAALGLVIVQVLALGFHASRGEMNVLGINIVLAALAAFVWWGRAKRVPIQPR